MLQSTHENCLAALGKYLLLAAQMSQERQESVAQPMQYVCLFAWLCFLFLSYLPTIVNFFDYTGSSIHPLSLSEDFFSLWALSLFQYSEYYIFKYLLPFIFVLFNLSWRLGEKEKR